MTRVAPGCDHNFGECLWLSERDDRTFRSTPKPSRDGWFVKRRDFIRNMSAGAAGLALAPMPLLNAYGQPDPARPNVLFILLEDLPDWIGCMGGHPDTLTPNIDALATRGVLFTNAHCGSPICNPSRVSLLLGKRPDTTGVYYNSDDWREMVPAGTISMPRSFRNNGYHLVRAGKIFHGTFDEHGVWDQIFEGRGMHNLPGHNAYTPGHPYNGLEYPLAGDEFFNWGPTDAPESSMADSRRYRFLRNLFNSGIRQPFFIGFGTHGAHFPAIAPRRHIERFDPSRVQVPEVNAFDLDDIPPAGRAYVDSLYHRRVLGHKQWHKAIAAYLATIHYLDEIVGRLIAEFDDSPYADNTIIVLCADHGFHLGEKMHWRKATLWQESTNVVLIVVAPGVTEPGGVCRQPVSLIDLYPTLNALCELRPVDGLEGRSIVPQLIDPDHRREQPAVVTLEEGNHAIIDRRWRYIRYADGGEELYDRERDPNEWTNLAGDPRYERVIERLAAWIPVPG